MGKGLLLRLIGIPIPIILLLWIFGFLQRNALPRRRWLRARTSSLASMNKASSKAAAYKTEAEAAKTPPGVKQFASAHGTPAQRLYNLLCLAYGADPQLFGNFVEKGYLPKERAEDCKDEYQQVAYAFQQLIGPHLDPVLAKEVMDKTWLPDAKWNVQGRRVGTPEMIHSGFASSCRILLHSPSNSAR
jgi:Putative metallopeptidase